MTTPKDGRQSFAELIDEWYGVGEESAEQIAAEVLAQVHATLKDDEEST